MVSLKARAEHRVVQSPCVKGGKPLIDAFPHVFKAQDGIRYSSVTVVQTCDFLFSSRRRHTRFKCDWSSDVCSSDLNQEQENLRAALRWFVEYEETELALRLCGALWWYWFMRGYYNEALHWLEAALAVPRTGRQTAARAQVLTATGFIHVALGHPEKAQAFLEESIALYEELGNRRGSAHALQFLAWVYEARGDYTMARSLIEQGLAHCRELGDKWNVGLGLNDLAGGMWIQGDVVAARRLWEECIALCQEIGEKWALPRTLMSLALMVL